MAQAANPSTTSRFHNLSNEALADVTWNMLLHSICLWQSVEKLRWSLRADERAAVARQLAL
jgi:hypothetical protein